MDQIFKHGCLKNALPTLACEFRKICMSQKWSNLQGEFLCDQLYCGKKRQIKVLRTNCLKGPCSGCRGSYRCIKAQSNRGLRIFDLYTFKVNKRHIIEEEIFDPVKKIHTEMSYLNGKSISRLGLVFLV